MLNRSNLNHSSRINEYWITRWWINEYWINRRRKNERQMRFDVDDKIWVKKEKFFTKVKWSYDSKFISTRDYIKWQILLRYAFSLIERSGFLVSKRRCLEIEKSNSTRFWKKVINDTIQSFKNHDFEKLII